MKNLPPWSPEAISLYNNALRKGYMQLAFELLVFAGLCVIIEATQIPFAYLLAAFTLGKAWFSWDYVDLLRKGNTRYITVREFEEVS